MDKSCFNKSLCCVSTKHLCRKFYVMSIISVVISVLNFVFSFILTGYSLGDSDALTEPLYVASLYVYCVLFGLSLLLTTHLGRYFSGSRQLHHGYAACCIYLINIIVPWTGLALELMVEDVDLKVTQIENNLYRNLLIFLGSFVVVSFWTSVFKPLVPEYCCYTSTNDYLNDSFDSSDSMYYQNGSCDKRDYKRDYLSSSTVLGILFICSLITLNIAVRCNKVNSLYYDLLFSLSVGATISSLLFQLILIAVNGIKSIQLTIDPMASFVWFLNIGFILIAGIVLFFVFFPYNGWSSIIDKSYEHTNNIRNIFILVQGGIAFLICLAILVYILTFVPRCCSSCRECCRESHQDAIEDYERLNLLEKR
jgi:hypothetical protein